MRELTKSQIAIRIVTLVQIIQICSAVAWALCAFKMFYAGYHYGWLSDAAFLWEGRSLIFFATLAVFQVVAVCGIAAARHHFYRSVGAR